MDQHFLFSELNLPADTAQVEDITEQVHLTEELGLKLKMPMNGGLKYREIFKTYFEVIYGFVTYKVQTQSNFEDPSYSCVLYKWYRVHFD